MTNTWHSVLIQQTPLIGTGSEWFWAMLQFVIVTLTLWLIYRHIRIQTSSHVISSLHALQARWSRPCMLRARLSTCESWLAGEHDFDVHDQDVAAFFEELGMYVNSELLPKKVIWDTYSWPIECYWRICQPGIVEMQNKFRGPSVFKEFEALATKMSKLNPKYGAPAFSLTDDELRRFFTGEVKTLNVELADAAVNEVEPDAPTTASTATSEPAAGEST